MSYISIRNHSIFIGRLCQDPELMMTASGKEIVNFNLAVDKGWGESKRTIFPRMVAFGTQAKYIAKLSKGAELSIIGEYDIREYSASNGEKRQSHEFTVCDVVAHGKKEAADAGKENQIPLAYANGSAPNLEALDSDVELPF